jgi:hypothetical protein
MQRLGRDLGQEESRPERHLPGMQENPNTQTQMRQLRRRTKRNENVAGAAEGELGLRPEMRKSDHKEDRDGSKNGQAHAELKNMDSALLFNIGNLFLFIASFPLLKTLIQDRNQLKGYSPIGTTLTFFGIVLFSIAFFVDGVYISNFLNLSTMIFWGVASFYSIRGFWEKRRKGPSKEK